MKSRQRTIVRPSEIGWNKAEVSVRIGAGTFGMPASSRARHVERRLGDGSQAHLREPSVIRHHAQTIPVVTWDRCRGGERSAVDEAFLATGVENPDPTERPYQRCSYAMSSPAADSTRLVRESVHGPTSRVSVLSGTPPIEGSFR